MQAESLRHVVGLGSRGLNAGATWWSRTGPAVSCGDSSIAGLTADDGCATFAGPHGRAVGGTENQISTSRCRDKRDGSTEDEAV